MIVPYRREYWQCEGYISRLLTVPGLCTIGSTIQERILAVRGHINRLPLAEPCRNVYFWYYHTREPEVWYR